jgi:hypothetical protein
MCIILILIVLLGFGIFLGAVGFSFLNISSSELYQKLIMLDDEWNQMR